ncbi:hypothetical protein Angca_001911 [Angiostrongylus cantonensis]|nr:hypothetical protein Angca_001911 [Angiostrongylus cantonensis]
MIDRSMCIIFILLTVKCLASEHILQLRDPPLNTVLISVPVNSTVIIRCERPPNAPKLRWLHNGNDPNLEHIVLSEDVRSSVILKQYNTKYHDGVYECYVGSLSASFRLRGEDSVTLPSGFRFCYKSENAACDHARACMADGMGRKSCVCYPGWGGESCNLPHDVQKANLINAPMCPYWRPMSALTVFMLCVTFLLIGVYSFKAKPTRKTFYPLPNGV